MVIKLKEGCLVNLKDIKIAKVFQTMGESWNIEISYYDDKKNPKEYIYVESQEEGNQLVDKLLEEIKNSKKIRVY